MNPFLQFLMSQGSIQNLLNERSEYEFMRDILSKVHRGRRFRNPFLKKNPFANYQPFDLDAVTTDYPLTTPPPETSLGTAGVGTAYDARPRRY